MEEKDAFYVVRKGDVIGVYNNFSDCQLQAGSSVCHPALSVYKGYNLPKKAEEHLVSHGLNNATYFIKANDVKDGLFGELVACPLQEMEIVKRKRSKSEKSCLLDFSGATKQNPGQCGAGAVLSADEGRMVWRLQEGIAFGTKHIAEYRAVILGLRYALKKGFEHIYVQGGSELVCMQIQGLWKCEDQAMAGLCMEARELKDKFVSFDINYIPKMYNIEAHTQAKLALEDLTDGEIYEECDTKYIKYAGVM